MYDDTHYASMFYIGPLSRYIQPICLPTGRYSEEEFTHTLPLALGWGTTYYDGEEVAAAWLPPPTPWYPRCPS